MEHNRTRNLTLAAVAALGIKNKILLLDIDGTLVPDGEAVVAPDTLAVVRTLQEQNSIYLTSNKVLPERNRAVAQLLGVPFVDTVHRKPNANVIASLPPEYKGRYVVIGDKWLTDGLFARHIGATFIKVRRLRGKHEPLLIRLSYLLDDVVAGCMGW